MSDAIRTKSRDAEIVRRDGPGELGVVEQVSREIDEAVEVSDLQDTSRLKVRNSRSAGRTNRRQIDIGDCKRKSAHGLSSEELRHSLLEPCQITSTPPGNSMRASNGPLRRDE